MISLNICLSAGENSSLLGREAHRSHQQGPPELRCQRADCVCGFPPLVGRGLGWADGQGINVSPGDWY